MAKVFQQACHQHKYGSGMFAMRVYEPLGAFAWESAPALLHVMLARSDDLYVCLKAHRCLFPIAFCLHAVLGKDAVESFLAVRAAEAQAGVPAHRMLLRYS